MTKVIEMPKIKELEKVVYNPLVKKLPAHNTEFKIMRIELDENFTRIDFVYNNGKFGWVQIDPKSYIRPVGSEAQYPLIKAQGIPLAPKKHYFKKENEVIYYTLYFAALPKSVRAIDIIEKESNALGQYYFNFYRVSMERVRNEKIEVGN